MASPHNNTNTESAEMEQIITEFFPKSLQIIHESRSPFMSSRDYSGEQMVSSSPSSSSSSVWPRDEWFNLALRECPAAHENLDLWHQSYFEPMIVDVILVAAPPVGWEPERDFSTTEQYPFHWNSDQEESGSEGKIEKIVERLLPAYKIFRDLNSSGRIRSYTLTHKVSSFLEPFTCKEEAEMQRFEFTPVDSSCGRLCLSVLYCSSLLFVSPESSTRMFPQYIDDYVGSPLAEPLKRFSSPTVVQGSLLSSPFSRRHSWVYDHGKSLTTFIFFLTIT
ncbi:hypothetical protein OIU79_030680 [Salix purpurea]|uniref:Autophagy-related protein 13 N-terminal domain-containing protein n=1 Tax=Salix purpurea TaxID=77065 RepID=A0A9Q0VB59_SALPP|nr:hypothetical protein OIU79_030680 [Salix purpurea]